MLNEKKLSKAELAKREDIIMKMKKNKSSLVKKYGKDAEKVMYGRATNIAKKQAESMENTKIREMIKSALMSPGADIEAGEDRYQGEKDLSQAVAMLDDLESKLKSHDWFYMMSDDNRAYSNGRYKEQEIRSLIDDLDKLGYGKDAKDLYNSLEPYTKAFPGGTHKLSEKKGKDMDGDGDIDSEDYLAARDAAIKKNLKEDWGSSDQSAMNQSIHRTLGNPTEFPGLTQIMDAAEDAVDFYWDEWPEYQTDREGLIMHAAQMYANKMFPEFMAGMRRMMAPIDERYANHPVQVQLRTKNAKTKKAKGEKVDEMDINDPIAMRLRANKDKLAKMRAANAGDDGNDKFFRASTANAKKLAALKDKRAEIMRDMEQEAEMEGGPIADRYGDMLNKIDKAIAKLEGHGEWGPERDTDIASQEIAKRAAMFGLEEDLDLGHEDNEPHMLKADLYRIGKYAMELYQMVDKFEESSEEVDFPHWWQSKIIKAKSMLVSAKHYLDFEVKEPQIDAMVDVAQDVKAIDEGTWSVGSSKEIKKVMDVLDMAMDAKLPDHLISILSNYDKVMYNVVGDDLFHDDIDGAKREASEGNMDRAMNRLSDAYSRAAYFQERQMDREGIKEEEAGEADMVASNIQKAMNANKGDDAKLYQLQQARKAMNKGDLDKAKKIVARYLKENKKKSIEEYLADGTIDEGMLDRLAANIRGIKAQTQAGAGNFLAFLKGDKDAIQNTSLAKNMGRLQAKADTLQKDLQDVENDIGKLFPPDVLEKTPEQFQSILLKYVDLLKNTKDLNFKIASGNIKLPTKGAANTPAPKPSPEIKTDLKVDVKGKEMEVFINDKNETYVKDEEGKAIFVTNDELKSLDFNKYKSAPKSKTSTQARDEKGRFVSTKKPDVKPELIDNNYEMTKKIYQYKGKNYQVQMDKKTKEEFFKHEDGRVMDIAAIDKNSKVKKPSVKK